MIREASHGVQRVERAVTRDRKVYRDTMQNLITRMSLAIDMLDPNDESSDAVSVDRLRTCCSDLTNYITMFAQARTKHS